MSLLAGLRLRVGFSPNPRVAPLIDGAVAIPGVEPTWETDNPGAMFHRLLTEDAFDVSEFSLATYIMLQDRTEPDRREWVALPIFLSKVFFQLGLLVREDGGIRGLQDLRGRSVGMPDFQMTAAVWLRAMLADLHGVRTREVTWVVGRPPSKSHAALLGVDAQPPAGLRIRFLGEEDSLDGLLHAGAVDAAFGDRVSVPLNEGGGVVPLLTQPEKRRLVSELFARSGVVPTNHTVVCRRAVLDRHPELAETLFAAFTESKRVAFERARRAAAGYLLFPDIDFDRQASEFGEDPFPCGLAATRRTVQRVADQLLEDGLIERRPDVDALFAPTLRGT